MRSMITNWLERLRGSIRVRLGLGLSFMLLPLLALGISSYVSSRQIIRGMEELVQTERDLLRPIMQLQNTVLQAAMPPNDFLILESDSERVKFEQLQREIESLFGSIQGSALMGRPKARSLVVVARESWTSAREVGLLLFYQGLRAGTQMKAFDARVDQTATVLGQLYAEVGEEIRQVEASARQAQRRATFFLIGTILLAAIATALIGNLLSQSITGPIRGLEEGLHQFSLGDHSFRMDATRTDEFGKLARTLNQMASQIECDSLTGLLSRPEFDRRIAGELVRSVRYGHTFSVLMLDLDHFKRVNDLHGHPAGDDVLRAITARLSRNFRSADCFARYGGEEFVAVLPETGAGGAKILADRFCEIVAAESVTTATGVEIQVTISIGCATYPTDGATAESLVAAADIALYSAKRSGRNRAETYHSGLEAAQPNPSTPPAP